MLHMLLMLGGAVDLAPAPAPAPEEVVPDIVETSSFNTGE